MPTPRRLLTLAAAAAAVTTLLSGCFLLPPSTAPHTVTTHTDESVAPGLERFYTQSLTWKTVAKGIDAAEVTVPLDWTKPAGATIAIAIDRHRASGRSLGSLLINPGGPGGSGYDFVHDYVDYIVTPDVLKNYDVIGFDPRGVGKSAPVVCYTDPKKEDQLLYGTYDAAYGSAQWYAELVSREKDWVAACEKNTGPLLGHLDAGSVARDMDVIRAVLGDTKLHYLGYSYGTYLGTIYANLFPKKVGRMVLDGAVDPQVQGIDDLATQMAGFDSALKAYMTECQASEKNCPFTGSVDDGLQQVRQLLDGIDARHLTAADGRQLDSATVGTGISETLYSRESWPDLTSMFVDLYAGSAGSTFDQADAYNNRNPDGTYSNGDDIYAAVTCDEQNLGTDDVDITGDLAKIQAAAPILGTYFAYDDTAVLEAACSNWPVKPAARPSSFAAKGAPPIIVIGTTNDPATPYAQSVSLAKQLSRGVLFTHHGEGHTVYAQGDTCIDTNVDAYLIRGTVPAHDPDCN